MSERDGVSWTIEEDEKGVGRPASTPPTEDPPADNSFWTRQAGEERAKQGIVAGDQTDPTKLDLQEQPLAPAVSEPDAVDTVDSGVARVTSPRQGLPRLLRLGLYAFAAYNLGVVPLVASYDRAEDMCRKAGFIAEQWNGDVEKGEADPKILGRLLRVAPHSSNFSSFQGGMPDGDDHLRVDPACDGFSGDLSDRLGVAVDMHKRMLQDNPPLVVERVDDVGEVSQQ